MDDCWKNKQALIPATIKFVSSLTLNDFHPGLTECKWLQLNKELPSTNLVFYYGSWILDVIPRDQSHYNITYDRSKPVNGKHIKSIVISRWWEGSFWMNLHISLLDVICFNDSFVSSVKHNWMWRHLNSVAFHMWSQMASIYTKELCITLVHWL